MKEFAGRPGADRNEIFEQAASEVGTSKQVVEKDFWVSLCLKLLFEADDFGDWLTFKGGTSLSKVYRLIERFSEDVDVSVAREHLQNDDTDLYKVSGARRERALKALNKSCEDFVQNQVRSYLQEQLSSLLPDGSSWSVKVASDDQMALVFEFPGENSNTR